MAVVALVSRVELRERESLPRSTFLIREQEEWNDATYYTTGEHSLRSVVALSVVAPLYESSFDLASPSLSSRVPGDPQVGVIIGVQRNAGGNEGEGEGEWNCFLRRSFDPAPRRRSGETYMRVCKNNRERRSIGLSSIEDVTRVRWKSFSSL